MLEWSWLMRYRAPGLSRAHSPSNVFLFLLYSRDADNSRLVSILGVRAESEEPVLLGEPVDEVLLGHRLARQVLAGPRLHPRQLDGRGLPQRRVAAAVALDHFLQEIRALQDDAA